MYLNCDYAICIESYFHVQTPAASSNDTVTCRNSEELPIVDLVAVVNTAAGHASRVKHNSLVIKRFYHTYFEEIFIFGSFKVF